MQAAFLHTLRIAHIGVICLCIGVEGYAQMELETPSAILPEEHFPDLKNFLGAATNRKLSRDLRASEARAREKASDAYGRTRAHAGVYGAYVVEDRENESIDTRTRLTWEVGAERTLFEFHDAIEARRSLGSHQSRQSDWIERQEEARWLRELRSIFIQRITAEQDLETRQQALKRAERELETLKALQAEGRIHEHDVMEAELLVRGLQENLKLSQKHTYLLQSSLLRYTGLSEIPAVSPADLQRLRKSRFDPLDDHDLSLPVLRAPSIEHLENEIALSDAQSRIAASSALPRVSSWARIYQDELQGPEFSGTVNRTNYEAIIGVRWNFWDSGQSRNLARAERLKGQRLERSRERLLASFQKDARNLQYIYETATSAVRMAEATIKLEERLLTAQEQASSNQIELLPVSLQTLLAVCEAETALWEAYAQAWDTRSAWMLFVHGDPFVER